MNTLYYGDNLKILREYIKDESVDLIYLDPPFNSNRNYNVLFRDESGSEAESQITAFEDTWHWNQSAEETYRELLLAGDDVSKMIEAFRSFIGTNQMMAYLVMMAVRLKELHRVLKSTGSLYLHCDPTASHYLKILLDTIFDGRNFRNELIWKRTTTHSGAKRFADVHDTILFYSKSELYTWNPVFQSYDDSYLKSKYRQRDDRGAYRLSDLTGAGLRGGDSGQPWRGFDPSILGRHWAVPRKLLIEILGEEQVSKLSTQEKLDALDQRGFIYWTPNGKKGGAGFPQWKRHIGEGVLATSVVSDIPPINSQAQERLGYPTQKPAALLERFLAASSNEGDVVLDPFCGCGTTIAAAQKLNRRWIGIDITHLSIALQKYRLKDAFGLEPVGAKKASAASPPYLRKSSAFPGDEQNDESGSAGGGGAADREGDATVKQSFTANKRAEPEYYQIIGEPEDLDGARQLATEDRYQFQWWALSLIKARPLGGSDKDKTGKKGADKGIDGTITFIDDNSGKAKRVIVSVKSGHVSVAHIRDLGHVIDREQAAIGVFLTLEPPTKPMITEALEKGFYHSPGWNRDYPRLQILTVEDLLNGKQVDMPPSTITFKQAEKLLQGGNSNQGSFEFDLQENTK